MLTTLRSLSKSKVGTGVAIVFLVLILGSFAMSDVTNLRSTAFGLGSATIAEAGKREVTDADLNHAMTRTLDAARQQKPDATYADLTGDFPQIVSELIDQRALQAFGDKTGFVLSKRLVDAEIAKLPGTKGLDGKFSDAAYQNFLATRQMTDAEVRRLLEADLTRRLLLIPTAANARAPLGVASPYASLQLERQFGEIGIIPVEAFTAGLNPTDGDLNAYYQQNLGHYTIPEQRILRFAAITPDALAAVPPTDADVAAYYKANAATYAERDERSLSQLITPDKAVADKAAAAARAGGAIPGGSDLGAQTRDAYATLAGNAAAATVFAAPAGAVIGPVRSDLGYVVVKVGTVNRVAGKSIEQARPDIIAKLAEQKKQGALGDVIAKIQDALDGGASYADVARQHGLTVVTTPPLTENGKSIGDPAYVLPDGYQAALKSGFDLAANDEPVVETIAPKAPVKGAPATPAAKPGFVLVGIDRIVAAAPAPLAAVRDRVRTDWIQRKAADRAKAAATDVAAKVAKGASIADALSGAGVKLPPAMPVNAQRYQIGAAKGPAQNALKMIFSLMPGKSRLVGDPSGQGFYVVRTLKVVPGNAMGEPSIVAQLQSELSNVLSEEMAAEFMTAVRADVKMRRNEAAIAAARQRILSPQAGQ